PARPWCSRKYQLLVKQRRSASIETAITPIREIGAGLHERMAKADENYCSTVPTAAGRFDDPRWELVTLPVLD
ncbi:MAG: hypothetical protein ACQEQY_11215, partial [Halobacteriota archaeon]